MSTNGKTGPVRRTVDTQRMEAAGRSVRRWLDTLKTRIVESRRPISSRRDDIAWEDGEPDDDSGGPRVM